MGDDSLRRDPPASKNYLSRQADEIIDSDTTWTDLALVFDVDVYRDRDGHPDWHSGTPFEPMFLATLWARVEDIPLSTIPDRLEDDHGLARAFGFDPRDLPSDSTFRPTRVKDRFSDLQTVLDNTARHIRHFAVERGAPIGVSLTRIKGETADNGEEPSHRTVQRMLRRKRKDVLEEMSDLVFPSLELERPDDTVYDDEELYTMETIAAIKGLAANQAGEDLGDLKNPDPDYDDPLNADGPSGETLLESMRDLSVEKIATVMNFTLQKLYQRAKPRLQELEKENGTRLTARARIAIDVTYVAYYGDREGMKWVQGAPDDKSYKWCHKFATVVIVGDNVHYILGVCPLGSKEYADTDAHAGKDKTYYPGDVARRLLSIANKFADIRVVYADRAFHSADVIAALEQHQLNYVIPARKDSRIQRKVNQFYELKRGYGDVENDVPLYVENDYIFHGRVKHATTNTRVTTNLVILPPDEDNPLNDDDDDDDDDEGSPQPFITNIEVSDEIAIDRRSAVNRIEKYSSRGGIETSYSKVKQCAPWTTSKDFRVRWYHFAFACIVYNVWLLVDFIVQERIAVITTRSKPRIKLEQFKSAFLKELGRRL